MAKRRRSPVPFTKAGPVTITKADGTVETRKPLRPRKMRRVVQRPVEQKRRDDALAAKESSRKYQ